MSRRWCWMVCCVSALAVLSSAGVVPSTEDANFVVTQSDVTSTTVAASSDVTTEEPLSPIKITEMDVLSEVNMRYSHTSVTTQVRNPAPRAQEATFRVLLPETAFISGFSMTIDGKTYIAYVKEKEEAKNIYNQAVSQGVGAAHVAAKARDSNHFTMSMNIEPRSTVFFNLTYEELLVRRNGVYNHAINLHPGALVPKLTVTVHIKEDQKLTVLRVPEVRTGNEIDATESDPQNSKAIIEKAAEAREATIKFTPDLEEQKRLMEIYAQKTKESQSQSHSHRWYDDDQEQEPAEGVLGQFVVQYDVDRPKNGEILVNDGYFVHFFVPTDLPPLNKHVVFVLDTSGSMMDRKIVQLREAMQTILSELNRGDYFSIVEFASSVIVHDLKEADATEDDRRNNYLYYESQSVTTLVPPFQATPENIAKAKIIVGRLNASGGTNIASALDTAVELIQKGIGWTQPATSNETKVEENTEAVASNDSPKDVTVKPQEVETSPASKDGAIKLEPIIIFLTDGDPTVGETDPKRIITHLSEKNYGENKATIFSLAFGEDADRKFLRKLSLRNEGFMRHIYEAADAALQLRAFYRQVSSPLLSHVKFVYSPDQVKEDSVTKTKFRAIYAGGEAVIAGRIGDEVTEISPEVLGFCGVDDGLTRKKYEVRTKVPVTRVKKDYLPLERLWAYLTIKQLLDERDAAEIADRPKEANGPESKALNLALKYEFVTPLTSLVVVKPNATKAVNAESVDSKDSTGTPILQAMSFYNSAAQSAPAASASYGPPAPGRPALAYMPISLKAAFSSAIGHVQYDALFAPIAPQSLNIDDYQEAEDLTSMISYEKDSTDDGFSNHRGSAMYGFATRNRVAPLSGLLPRISYTTRPLILSTTPVFTTEEPNPLQTYGLQDFTWAKALLNVSADELVLPPSSNATEPIHLKLSRETDIQLAPKSPSGDEACPKATDGAPGACVYLTRCAPAANITAELYSTTYCLVNNEYAGVCCPKTS